MDRLFHWFGNPRPAKRSPGRSPTRPCLESLEARDQPAVIGLPALPIPPDVPAQLGQPVEVRTVAIPPIVSAVSRTASPLTLGPAPP